jgi:hypothetical protein
MASAIRSTAAALVLALGVCGTACAQMVITSADDEAEHANPGRSGHRAGPHGPQAAGDFHQTMDQVFGQGRWRQTSGYRSQAQEDALRRAGAGTVAPGHVSRHSVGGPETPGAYDAVVPGMSNANAAARLRGAGVPFKRVLAEARHGPEGPHLHIEVDPNAAQMAQATQAAADLVTIYRRIVNGQRNPELTADN